MAFDIFFSEVFRFDDIRVHPYLLSRDINHSPQSSAMMSGEPGHVSAPLTPTSDAEPLRPLHPTS
jgi:hypothetical protein